jgi:Putative prokaryotic signal transducing protein
VSETAVAAVAGSRAEAQLIAGLLEANGIAAIVSTDDAGGQEPQWQLTEGVRVLVATHDLASAQALISEPSAGQTPTQDRHHGHDQEQPPP